MKISILFIILAFTSLLQNKLILKLIISHSNYNNNNGIACVAYGDVYSFNEMVYYWKFCFTKKIDGNKTSRWMFFWWS
jgi:hypothetical protein